jgi:hypothetical protein
VHHRCARWQRSASAIARAQSAVLVGRVGPRGMLWLWYNDRLEDNACPVWFEYLMRKLSGSRRN